MNIIQKFKLMRNIKNSINPVGTMISMYGEQYKIVENNLNICCSHRTPDYSNEGSGLTTLLIKNMDTKQQEVITGLYARYMFNILEKKHAKQVKSK